MAAYLLLLLPALALARIEVEVTGKFNGDNSNMAVYVSGSETDIISEEEIGTFKLQDSSLKDAVRAYFGSQPSDAYLRSPTPWADLYQSFGWSQVQRTLVPTAGRILKITSEPQIVLQQVFQNNSTKPATFNVGISQSVVNMYTSSWSRGGELSVSQEISYEFDIEVMNVGGKTSFGYTSSWGEDTEKSQAVTVGSSSSMELMLQPEQAVLAQLEATRGSIQVEVEYEARLSGAVAVNYDKTYKGHHFWALDVQAVMSAGGMSNKMVSKQIINIGFYSNAKVTVHDRQMGYKIMQVDY